MTVEKSSSGDGIAPMPEIAQSLNGMIVPPLPADQQSEPYSIYTSREKWFIVCMVAVSGLYSPLPANIYFPAIPTLSKAFGESIEALNQSVTVYLVFQGICTYSSLLAC